MSGSASVVWRRILHTTKKKIWIRLRCVKKNWNEVLRGAPTREIFIFPHSWSTTDGAPRIAQLGRFLFGLFTMSENGYSIITYPNPPFAATLYRGQESFFGGEAPLSEGIGYLVVLGFGFFFSIFTSSLVYLNKYFGQKGEITSEHFK
jgi:hypothetical protein